MVQFWKRVDRAYPGSLAVWVLEHQRNGNPRVHLVVRWGTELRHWISVRLWVATAWSEIAAAGRDDPADAIAVTHIRAGTSVGPARVSASMAMAASTGLASLTFPPLSA